MTLSNPQWITVLLLLIGIAKCFKIAKRETTSRICVYALMFVLSGYVVAIIVQIFEAPDLQTRIFSTLAAYLSLLLCGTGGCIAVIGLVEYRKNRGYTQGRAQAISALVICLFFLAGAGLGYYNRVKDRFDASSSQILSSADSESLKFPDLNFKYAHPGKPYVSLDPKSLNEDASLVLLRTHPQIYFLIIAEQLGFDGASNSDDLVKVCQANLQSVASQCRFYDQQLYQVNNLNGIQYRADTTINGVALSYVFWVVETNGYSYQLIAFGKAGSKDRVWRESRALFTNFEQIDRGRIFYAQGSGPFGNHESKSFGYRLELADTPWMRWKEVNADYPAAEVGAYINDDAFAVVVPIYYGSQKPSLDMLTEVLLDNSDVDYPPQAINDRVLFQDGAMQGSQIKYTYKSQDDVYDVRCKIVSGSQTGLLAAIWMKDRSPDKERLFKQFFSRMRVSPEISRSIDDLGLGQEQKKKQANLINSLGLKYHKLKKYEFALHYFKLASELHPEEDSYLTNCLDSFNRLGSHQDALAFLASRKGGLADNPEVLSWKAWHLNKANKKDQALICYKKLFATNYKNDEDFDVYVELLAEKKQWDRFEAAFEAYLKHNESLALKLKQTKILQKHGNHEKAIDKLLALQDGLPFKSEIAYALIQNYHAVGQPQSALAVSNKLIENGHRTADAYYCKGDSEYRLKWYRKAKKSFEKAHELAPNDDGINDYIKHVSSLLGEGSNSSVKRFVKPVAIPELITEKMASPKDAFENDGFDSYYLNIIRGFSYKRGEHYRQTTYKRIKVLNVSGVSRFSTLEIDFDPLHERIYVNHLVVRDPKGDIVSEGNPDDYYVIDKQKDEIATYDQTLFIPVPHLLPGYTIEIASTIERKRAPTEFPFVKSVMGASRPVLFYAVFYEGDSKAIHYKPVNTTAPVATKNGLAWIVEDPPIYRWEPLMVHYESFLPVVLMGSSEQQWEQIGQEYLERIKDTLVPDSQVRTLAKQLVQKATSTPAKIDRLALYVQKNYAYKAIEFGSRGLIPNCADVTMKNKYGDCKDHALLMHQLLNAVSIPSQLALVNTRSQVEQSLPSMDQFNHMIVFIPAENGGRFLDVTDKDIDLTLATPVGLADRAALILDPLKIHFAQIPAYDDHSIVNSKREIDISDKGGQRIAEHVELSGYVAGFFRNTLKSIEKDDHLDWMQRMGGRYQSAVNILSFDVSNLFDNAKPLVLDLTYEINGPALQKSIQSNLKVPSIWEHYYLDERPVRDRQTDFKIAYPFVLQSNVVLKAPDGFIVSEFDNIKDGGSSAFGQWQIQIKKTRHACHLNLYCKLVPGVFSSDSYSHYQSMMVKAVQAINRNVFFEKDELTARSN